MSDRQLMILAKPTGFRSGCYAPLNAISSKRTTLFRPSSLARYNASSACRIRISGCDEHPSPPAEGLCEMKQEKIIAAPGLDPAQYGRLQDLCSTSGFTCINSGMRDHLSGVDIGFTIADLAIAETGTLVVNCPGEELRLATMLSEYHVCVVHRSTIVEDAFAAEQHMLKYLHKTPDYTAFITGASRTADIERVLTLGVHGPLELHILLLED